MTQLPIYAYEDEWGFNMRIESEYDATGASTRQVELKAPDGTKELKTVTAVTTDADGDFDWLVTEDYFVGKAGRWTAQLVLTFADKKLREKRVRAFRIGEATSAN